MTKGTRVKFSAEWLKQFHGKGAASRTGTVISPRVKSYCVTVKWDDRKSKSRYHVYFLEAVK